MSEQSAGLAGLGRRNALERQQETWKPPLFRPVHSAPDRVLAAVRRFVDLQAGSIYRDLAVLLPARRGTILDVGCGAQPFRPLVRSDAKYMGIDTADAKDHFGYELPDTTYYSGDTWPVADASVDTVLCTETLEHVMEPQPFLLQAGRCLKPGGLLILTVPFAARWHFIPYDYWRYTPSGLKHLMQRAGFERIEVYPRGNALTVACYKLMAVMLQLFFPQFGSPVVVWTLRAIGLLLSPLLLALAAVANLSLSVGGDDCLGYTAVAQYGSADGAAQQ